MLGNPPYISANNQIKDSKTYAQREQIKELGMQEYYKMLHKKWDLYIVFIEQGISYLCRTQGVCTMIVPYPFTNQPYAQKSREMITNEYCLIELSDLKDTKVFKTAEVLNCIVLITKKPQASFVNISKINTKNKIKRIYKKPLEDFIQDSKSFIWNTTNKENHISRYSNLNTLGDFCYISVGMGLHSSEKNTKYKFTKNDLISATEDSVHCKKYVEGKDIERYALKKFKFLEYDTERCPSQCREPRFRELFEQHKIIINKIGDIKATIDDSKFLCDQTIRVCVLWNDLKDITNKSISASIKKYSTLTREKMELLSKSTNLKYLLGLLNSKYIALLLDEIRGKGNIDLNPDYLRKIPIPKITASNQHIADSIIALSDEILAVKAQDSSIDTSHLEARIDCLVYTLYGLSQEEIHIIQGGVK